MSGWKRDDVLAVWTKRIAEDELHVKRVGRGRNLRYLFTASLSFRIPCGIDEVSGSAKSLENACEQAERAYNLLGAEAP